MSTDDDNPSNLSVAARRISASLIEGVHLRLALFSLELGEERRRVTQVVVASVALALVLFMAFLCVNAAVLIIFWDTHRVPIALGMCGFYGVIAALLGLLILRRVRRDAAAFATTREVLETDRQMLRGDL